MSGLPGVVALGRRRVLLPPVRGYRLRLATSGWRQLGLRRLWAAVDANRWDDLPSDPHAADCVVSRRVGANDPGERGFRPRCPTHPRPRLVSDGVDDAASLPARDGQPAAVQTVWHCRGRRDVRRRREQGGQARSVLRAPQEGRDGRSRGAAKGHRARQAGRHARPDGRGRWRKPLPATSTTVLS